ncbi:MAG: porin [Bacteroidales bacterium]|nr:porin [Bacteroidales bacterium]
MKVASYISHRAGLDIHNAVWLLVLFSSFFILHSPLSAQPADSTRLRLELEHHHFFRNNEYGSDRMDGYTLPGFYMRPKMVWQVEPHVRLAVGLHWLNYWGAHQYPSHITYSTILPDESENSSSIHLLPWVQARVDFFPGVTLLLGSLESNSGHLLPLPLYNPERRYATDPEAGVQLLVERPWVEADLWANWNEFIFNQSRHQENFHTGLSARFKWNIGGHWTLQLPLYAIVNHRGGEVSLNIGTRNHGNFSTGLAATYRLGHFSASLEVLMAAFSQKRDTTLAFSHGKAFSPTLTLRYREAKLTANYWVGDDFFSLLGSDHFSNRSTNTPGMTIERNKMLTLAAAYTWKRFRSCTVSFEGDLIHYYPYVRHCPPYEGSLRDSRTLFGFGMHIQLNPSIRLLP